MNNQNQNLFNLLLTQIFHFFLYFLGILYGTMTLELGGQITIACEKTGYSAQLEFKLKVLRTKGAYSKIIDTTCQLEEEEHLES